jgi:hypothetical protein
MPTQVSERPRDLMREAQVLVAPPIPTGVGGPKVLVPRPGVVPQIDLCNADKEVVPIADALGQRLVAGHAPREQAG